MGPNEQRLIRQFNVPVGVEMNVAFVVILRRLAELEAECARLRASQPPPLVVNPDDTRAFAEWLREYGHDPERYLEDTHGG